MKLPITAAAFMTMFGASLWAADLERFLPADGNNVHAEKGLLRSWPAGGPKELWRIHIGYGKSAIAESRGRAYTATEIDKKQYALCLDPATGKTIWKVLLLPKGNSHGVKGPVTSPLVDGEYVYFFPYENEKGNAWYPHCPCVCLRTADGSEVWRESKQFNCSEGPTPLIVGDVLYIGGGGKENILAAVDKKSGKLLWKTGIDRDTGATKFFVTGSSLTYQEVGGIGQIIVSVYRNTLMGVHARTGKALWYWTLKNPTFSGSVPTPVAVGSNVLISAAQREVTFSQCLGMTVRGETIEPVLLYESDRLQCNTFHTPSVVDGAAYGFGKGQTGDALQCTNVADGKLLWQQEGDDWARDRQLTAADGLLFAVTKKDELVLLEASRRGYKELGRVQPGIKMGLPQQPMIANGRLYLRGDETLVCYQVGQAATK